jgi:hypothetical protein
MHHACGIGSDTRNKRMNNIHMQGQAPSLPSSCWQWLLACCSPGCNVSNATQMLVWRWWVGSLAGDCAADAVAAVVDLLLQEHWPGSELRTVNGGHVSAFLMHQDAFRGALRDSLARLEAGAPTEGA